MAALVALQLRVPCSVAAWEGLPLRPWEEPVWGLQQSQPEDPQVQQAVALVLQAWGQKLQQELHAQPRAAWQQRQSGAASPAWTLSCRSAAVLAVQPPTSPCWGQQGRLWQAAAWQAEPMPAAWQLWVAWRPGTEAVQLLRPAAQLLLLEGQAARAGGSSKRRWI